MLISLFRTSNGSSTFVKNAITGDNGSYLLEDLPAGTYTVVQSQPEALVDGAEFTDDNFAVVGEDEISNIVLTETQTRLDYHFTEMGAANPYISIALYFASNLGDPAYLRDAMADAEEAAGNVALAEAIRDGLTSFEIVEEEESSLLVEDSVDAAFSGTSVGTSAITAPVEAGDSLDGLATDDDTLLEEVDTVLEETDDWLVL